MFKGLKRPVREADRLPPYSAEVNVCGNVAPVVYAFMFSAGMTSPFTFHLLPERARSLGRLGNSGEIVL